MATYKTFEELDCWKKCRRTRIWVHQFLIKYSRDLDEDLIKNMKRASRSTTRNIAEGFGRFHFKDNIRFCRISLGSLFEIKDDLLIGLDENRITVEEVSEGIELIQASINSVLGYINYLRSGKKK